MQYQYLLTWRMCVGYWILLIKTQNNYLHTLLDKDNKWLKQATREVVENCDPVPGFVFPNAAHVRYNSLDKLQNTHHQRAHMLQPPQPLSSCIQRHQTELRNGKTLWRLVCILQEFHTKSTTLLSRVFYTFIEQKAHSTKQ